MKDKIFIFIMGLLVGAIITSAGFLACRKNNHNMPQMPNGEPRQMTEMNNSDRMQRRDNSNDNNSQDSPENSDVKDRNNNKKENSNNKDNSNNKSKLPSKENSSTNNTNS